MRIAANRCPAASLIVQMFTLLWTNAQICMFPQCCLADVNRLQLEGDGREGSIHTHTQVIISESEASLEANLGAFVKFPT